MKNLTNRGGWRTQNKLRQDSKLVLFKFSRNFTSRSRSFFISLSLLDLDFQSFSFHFHFSISISSLLISLCTSREKWKIFFFTFHISIVQNPLSQDTDRHIHAAQYLRNAAGTVSQDSQLQNNTTEFFSYNLLSKYEIKSTPHLIFYQYERAGRSCRRFCVWLVYHHVLIKSCILGQSPQRRGFSTMWKGEEGRGDGAVL